jgi:predicted XRE-type DNA-binding protein
MDIVRERLKAALAMPQPKVSLLLRGQFRGISEAKMLECLARLGRDIDIVVKPARRKAVADSAGQVNVVFV